MLRYEVLLLTIPEITADEARLLESQLEKLLHEHKALLISFERWGKYRLAYAVRGNDYGVYFLLRCEIMPEELKKFLADFSMLVTVKLHDVIMRYTIGRLDPNASLSYHRPESLEEISTRDVETFLKESKMSGFLSQKPGPFFSQSQENAEIHPDKIDAESTGE